MLVLISYATNSGGTYEAGKIIKELAEKDGHDVMLMSVIDTKAEHINKADFVFFGSNSWDGHTKEGKRLEGQLPPHFHKFKEDLGNKKFAGKRCSVYGLGDIHYTYVCGSAEHLKNFVKEIEGELVGEPLRLAGFLYDMNEKVDELSDWANGILKEL